MRNETRALGYADDVIFLTKGIDPSTLTDLMQSAINKALSWARENGVTFGAKKTQAVVFHTRRARNKPKFPKLKMGTEELVYTNSMKYLGLTIQHNLSWTKHIEDKCLKAKRLLNQTKAAVGREWGLSLIHI